MFLFPAFCQAKLGVERLPQRIWVFPSTGMAISELWQAQFGKGDAQLTPVVFLSLLAG